jgi:NRPS condensation-like uncharacterized protein
METVNSARSGFGVMDQILNTPSQMKYKITPFDRLFLADDRAGFPMVFFMKFILRNRINRRVFEMAISHSLERHPFLQCYLHGKKLVQVDQLVMPIIRYQESSRGNPFKDAFTPINLRRSIGLEIDVNYDDGNSSILLKLHHVVSDAKGACKFMEDLMIYYHSLTLNTSSKLFLQKLNPVLLNTKPNSGHRAKFSSTYILATLRMLLRHFSFFPQQLSCLGGSRHLRREPCDFSAVSTILSTELTSQIISAAKCLGVSVNDLFIRDLGDGIIDWNRAQFGKDLRLRICLPINMRRSGHSQMPARNFISYGFLDISPSQAKNRSNNLAIITKFMTRFKKLNLGTVTSYSVKWISLIPFGLKLFMTHRICQSTAVLSNLGITFESCKLPQSSTGNLICGDLELAGVELLPPYRPKTNGAIGVVNYNGRLSISLHYNRDMYDQIKAGALLESFVSKLKISIEERPAGFTDLGPNG